MTFLGTNHEPSFPKSPVLSRILFQNPNLIGKSTSMKQFLAVFCIKTLRKRNFKIPYFQAPGLLAGIAEESQGKSVNVRKTPRLGKPSNRFALAGQVLSLS
jgi:hypothetical protein